MRSAAAFWTLVCSSSFRGALFRTLVCSYLNVAHILTARYKYVKSPSQATKNINIVLCVLSANETADSIECESALSPVSHSYHLRRKSAPAFPVEAIEAAAAVPTESSALPTVKRSKRASRSLCIFHRKGKVSYI